MTEQRYYHQPTKHRGGGRRCAWAGQCSAAVYVRTIVIQLYSLGNRNKNMVRPGFEPGTFCVLDRCDNQLRHRTAQRVPQKFLPEQEDARFGQPSSRLLAGSQLNTTYRLSAMAIFGLWVCPFPPLHQTELLSVKR